MFVPPVEVEMLKTATFSASWTMLLIPMKENRKPGSIHSLFIPDRLHTLLQGEVLALSVSLCSRSASFWCAQLAPGNKTDKAPCSSETLAHCVMSTPVQTQQCTCTDSKKGMGVHHLPNCWYKSPTSLSHKGIVVKWCSSFSHAH